MESFYKNPKKDSSWLTRSKNPLIAYSNNILGDIHSLKIILDRINKKKLHIYKWSPKDNDLPFLLGLMHNGKIYALLVEVSACHSYNTIIYKKHSELRVASLDTLITLFYGLSFIKGLEGLVSSSFSCIANSIAALSSKTRDLGKNSGLEPIPLTCMGHQPSKESLLLAKYLRIQEWKKTRKNRPRYSSTKKVVHQT